MVGSVAGALPPTKSLFYRLFRGKEVARRPDDARIPAFSALIDNDGAYDAPAIDPDRTIALIQFTGGTTGTPKGRTELQTSELSTLMRISYAVFCLKKQKIPIITYFPSSVSHSDEEIERAYKK